MFRTSVRKWQYCWVLAQSLVMGCFKSQHSWVSMLLLSAAPKALQISPKGLIVQGTSVSWERCWDFCFFLLFLYRVSGEYPHVILKFSFPSLLRVSFASSILKDSPVSSFFPSWIIIPSLLLRKSKLK